MAGIGPTSAIHPLREHRPRSTQSRLSHQRAACLLGGLLSFGPVSGFWPSIWRREKMRETENNANGATGLTVPVRQGRLWPSLAARTTQPGGMRAPGESVGRAGYGGG